MSDLDAAVLAYYDGNARREHERLERPDCALEFDLTTRILAVHLPPAARILELGGGSGRYARWLAERGHRVVFTDLSAELLAVAREHLADVRAGVDEIVQTDARDLSQWSDGEFDAVVALGPFYHLTDEADRLRAIHETARGLRPGGVACVVVIPRYAFLRGILADRTSRRRLHDPAFLARILDDGVFTNDRPGRFTGVYGVEPSTPDLVLRTAELTTVAAHAVEGFASDLQSAAAELLAEAPEAYDALLDTLHARSADRSLFGTANHLLLVLRKHG